MLLSERSQSRKATSNYRTLWKRQNYGDSGKISSFQEVGVERVNRQTTADFHRSKSILHIAYLCYFTFAQTHGITPS